MSTRVWDCHSDVLSKLLDQPISRFVSGEGDGPELHCELAKLAAGGVGVQVCALFVRNADGEHPAMRTLRMIDIAHRLEDATGGRVRVVRTGEELDATVAAGGTALVLSIENGIACMKRMELLRTYHRLGVRAVGLVWNGRNFIADGCGEQDTGGGLTSFGREVVAEMERLGMLVDVSHLSESGFWDVLEHTSGPLIASHSNVRALCDHPRNLRDEQIRAVAERGGVIGVNFYPVFLRHGETVEDTSIDDIVRHTVGLIERAGEDAVGMGSDYDGIPRGPRGAEDPSCYPALADALREAGLSQTQLDKVLWGNFRRVFGVVLGG
jgi:membrane dipeptidase